jgi:pilus assembly protein CpaF
MSLVTEAFPIVVFTKQLEDKQRKMMEVMECEILLDGQKNFRSLYRFNITENRMDGDRFIINGSHQQENTVSKSLQKRFLENGMPQEVLNKILKGGPER